MPTQLAPARAVARGKRATRARASTVRARLAHPRPRPRRVAEQMPTPPDPASLRATPRPNAHPRPDPPPRAQAVRAEKMEVEQKCKFTAVPFGYFAREQLDHKGPRTNVDRGDPHDFSRPMVKGMQGGRASCGSWACSEGGWDSPNPRGTTEWFYVFSGARRGDGPRRHAPPLRPRRRSRLTQGMARAVGRARVHPQGVAGVRARGRGRRESQAGGDARVAARPVRCAELWKLWTNRQRVLRRGVRQGGRLVRRAGNVRHTRAFIHRSVSRRRRRVLRHGRSHPTAPAPGGACEATPSSSPRVGTVASTSSGNAAARAVCCEVSRDEARAHGGVAPGAARPTAEALAASRPPPPPPAGGFAPSVRAKTTSCTIPISTTRMRTPAAQLAAAGSSRRHGAPATAAAGGPRGLPAATTG